MKKKGHSCFPLILALALLLVPLVSHAVGDYTDNGDSTVTDNETGMMWIQNQAGVMNWQGTLSYCETLELAAYTDWRLPNIKEFQTVVDDSVSVVFDGTYFSWYQSAYWSSTTAASTPSEALILNWNGEISLSVKSISKYIVCVRGGL